jgi:hypothetical protein
MDSFIGTRAIYQLRFSQVLKWKSELIYLLAKNTINFYGKKCYYA